MRLNIALLFLVLAADGRILQGQKDDGYGDVNNDGDDDGDDDEPSSSYDGSRTSQHGVASVYSSSLELPLKEDTPTVHYAAPKPLVHVVYKPYPIYKPIYKPYPVVVKKNGDMAGWAVAIILILAMSIVLMLCYYCYRPRKPLPYPIEVIVKDCMTDPILDSGVYFIDTLRVNKIGGWQTIADPDTGAIAMDEQGVLRWTRWCQDFLDTFHPNGTEHATAQTSDAANYLRTKFPHHKRFTIINRVDITDITGNTRILTDHMGQNVEVFIRKFGHAI